MPFQVLSLGAGVQSSTMALMAAHGDITPMPDCAIFADTMDEPSYVYEWLDWLETKLPFPVYKVVQGEGLSKAVLKVRLSKKGINYTNGNIPVFVKKQSGKLRGMLSRQCTFQYKIVPIRRKIRELLGSTGRRSLYPDSVRMWIGISTDESIRMKPSGVLYITNTWPLIEYNISRDYCLKWMEDNNYPIPKRSSCIFCPFHNDNDWKIMKEEDPTSFARAVQFEKDYDKSLSQTKLGGIGYFLHDSCVPLGEIDFNKSSKQPDLFNNECEGMCGL